MAEIAIKRVNFFDGQFLREGEFQAEQTYHTHMRWRLNYLLFEQNGVVALDSPDDLKFFDLVNGAKTFRVRAGMAIGRRALIREAKEIVLAEDTQPFDLGALGIGSPGTAFVAIHYEEEKVIDPPSEGDVNKETRVNEKAVLTVHAAHPGALAPNDEPFVLLGKIIVDNAGALTEDYTGRDEAKIRASLIAGTVSSGTATITSISVPSGAPATSFPAQIVGTSLSGATAVVFDDSDVTAVIQPGGDDTNVPVQITIAAGAGAGSKTFTVTTPTKGTASSSGVSGAAFQVTAPAAVVVSQIQPPVQSPGGAVTVHGTNIRNPALPPGPATGTSVEFLDATTASVVAIGLSPEVLNDVSGKQRVRVTIPPGSAFTPSHSSGDPDLSVKVRVSFGTQGVSAVTLTIKFP